jgi:pimeloyl-ACP methyl ester carboxylesterase
MIRKLVVITLFVAVLLPIRLGAGLAQDENWTCDEGPNDIVAAAEAAYDPERVETAADAYTLAAQAEVLCRTDRQRFREAKLLRQRFERLAGYTDPTTMLPGRVDLGEYSLFLHCTGEGGPTVIFEHGWGGASLMNWNNVQPAVSTVTRSCAYDRLGVVPSDRVPQGTARTTQDQVDDLLDLLDAADIDPPYILVGHSMAGINLLLFTDQDPDLIAGIVLVDAVHPDFLEEIPDYPLPGPDDPSNSEHFDIVASTAQVAHIRDVGDRPLAVLKANSGLADKPEWEVMQTDYTTYSSNSCFTVAERSGHEIMNTEPELIIDAILWVLDEVHAVEE